jgi:threonine dehydrogenase-like Zn-dependent dehydrogenase
MKAITFTGVESVSYEEIADPKILEEGDAIVKVSACAICGSDLHVFHGRETGIDVHAAMGHEFSGTIVETGKSVCNFKVGDRVMSPFTTSCGQCFYCLRGLTCRCVKSQLFGWVENGKGLHGGQAEYVRVPLADQTLMRIPEGLSFETAVLLGDIIPTGFFSARQAGIKPGDVVAVVGCGPVGLMAILGAFHYGAAQVFAFDRVGGRLQAATHFGAQPIHSEHIDERELLLQVTEGRGPDVILEAVGSASSVKLAFDLVRPGGTVSAVGVCTEKTFPFSPVQAYDKNLTWRSGRCPARAMMPELLPVVQNDEQKFLSIITHRLPLADGPAAYSSFASRSEGMLKVMLRP